MQELILEDLLDFLKNNELKYKSTHAKLCFKIIQRIHKKLINGIRFDEIKIDDGVIVNGHHRFVCLSFLDFEVEWVPWTKNPSDIITPWPDVLIIDEEWENDEVIEEHNKIWGLARNSLNL